MKQLRRVVRMILSVVEAGPRTLAAIARAVREPLSMRVGQTLLYGVAQLAKVREQKRTCDSNKGGCGEGFVYVR
jgi:hypothetical protein